MKKLNSFSEFFTSATEEERRKLLTEVVRLANKDQKKNMEVYRNCEECGVQFVKKPRRRGVYCSEKCRLAQHKKKNKTMGKRY